MNSKEVSVLLKKLSFYFPNQIDFPVGDENEEEAMIRTWLEPLKPYTLEEVWEATKTYLYKNDYPPHPIKLVREIQQNNSDLLSAGEAWSRVIADIESGYHEDNYDLPPLVKETLECIGGKKNLEGNQDKIGYMKEFKETYRQLVQEQREKQVQEKIRERDILLLEEESDD